MSRDGVVVQSDARDLTDLFRRDDYLPFKPLYPNRGEDKNVAEQDVPGQSASRAVDKF